MITLSFYSERLQDSHGEKMSSLQAAYAFSGILFFLLGTIFFFIDEMLLWSVGFFVMAILLVLIKVMWNIAGWAENVTRKLGDDC